LQANSPLSGPTRNPQKTILNWRRSIKENCNPTLG
jgi:hypothetical protein